MTTTETPTSRPAPALVDRLFEALAAESAARTRAVEALSLDYSSIYGLDPRDLGIGDDPNFLPQGAGGTLSLRWLNRTKRGEYIPAFLSEQQLSIYRRRIRALVVDNEIALNAVSVQTSYAVGSGFSYEVQSTGPKAGPSDVSDAQAVIDAFVEHNELGLREQETFERVLIDGESFWSLWPTGTGLLSCRFIEPEHVYSPNGSKGDDSFGVVTAPRDVETVRGYMVVQGHPDEGAQPEFVPADSVLHFKHHETPRTSKRGLSAFYPLETTLRAVEDLVISTVSLAKARAKVAWFRKLEGSSADVASALVAQQAAAQVTDPGTGQALNIERLRYGSILTIPSNMGIEMPAANISAADHVGVLSMVLRVIAARFSMPEYLIASDASNGNYSSLLVAESPFVKGMGRIQGSFGTLLGGNRWPGARQSAIWRQLRHAAECGLLDRNALAHLKVQTKGPTLTVRDPEKEASTNKTYHEMRVKSAKTIQLEQGLDPDVETKNLQEEEARKPKPPPPPAPGTPGAPGAPEGPVGKPPGAQALESSDWDESKHQRADDGKFGSGGSGKAEGKAEGKAGAKRSRAERQEHRAAASHALAKAEAHVERVGKAAAEVDGLHDEPEDDHEVRRRVRNLNQAAMEAHDELRAHLEDLPGGSGAGYAKQITDAFEGLSAKLDRYEHRLSQASGKLRDLKQALAEHESKEPVAPEEPPDPEYPNPPEPAEFLGGDEDPAYLDAQEKYESQVEKIDAAHQKAYEKFAAAEERYNERFERWSDRRDDLDERASNASETVSRLVEEVNAEVESYQDDLADAARSAESDVHADADEEETEDGESVKESSDWDESKHKRASDGKFGSGGGKASGKPSKVEGKNKGPSKKAETSKGKADKGKADKGFTGRKQTGGQVRCYSGGKPVSCAKAGHSGGERDEHWQQASKALNALAQRAGALDPKLVEQATASLRMLSSEEVDGLKKELGIRAGGPKQRKADKLVREAARELRERQRWTREARKAGVSPRDLHQVAREMHEIDRGYQATVKAMLAQTRELFKEKAGKALTKANPVFRNGGDPTQLEGWDLVARTMADRYPEILGAHGYEGDNDETDAAQKLFEMVAEGTPRVAPRSKAYGKALEYLVERSGLFAGQASDPASGQDADDPSDSEEIPF